MAGQMVKGQLLTRVSMRLGLLALVRVHRIRNVAVRKRKVLEAIFRSCVCECERVRDRVEGLVEFYRNLVCYGNWCSASRK